MFGNPFQAILGPPGPSWAHLGPLSQPSCHPTSPLGTSKAELRPPKPHLASFAKPSTCPEHRYLRRFSEVCYLPSSQHVALNLALQNPKIKPKSLPRHPKIGPISAKKTQDGSKMATDLQSPILQALLKPRPAQNTIIHYVLARFATCPLRNMLLPT